MKRIILFFALLSAVILAAGAAESADQLLGRAADKLRTSKSVSASFSVKASAGNASGTITLAGDKFRITSQDLSVWYNGKTQWTYMPSAGEVNITEPTAEELQQINPFAIVNAMRRGYKAAITSRTAANTVLTLTATARRPEIKKAVLTLSNATLYPSKIILTMADGSVTAITVSNVKAGAAQAASAFVFNPAKYPGVEVVDLR